MKRVSRKEPGYDCVRHPCGKYGCGTSPGSSHGIACETWHYAVVDERTALTLQVMSGVFPDSVPDDVGMLEYPMPTYIHLHASFPAANDPVEQECEFLGQCRIAAWGIGSAAELWDQAADKDRGFEQPESFWLALEERCRELTAEAELAATA